MILLTACSLRLALLSRKILFLDKALQKFFLLIMLAGIVWIVSWFFLKKIGEQVGFAINSTSSQPPGLYTYFPIYSPLQRGELVDCSLGFKRLLKNIGAVPGDWLFTVYPIIYVCKNSYFTKNCTILGRCLPKDKNGRPLLCQLWWGKEIPSNYFYLLSNRVVNSFDSRYFGLVPIKSIHHRVKIILDLS